MIHPPDFSSARVFVVGDVMLDSYWHGPTSRISPEAPVPVVQVHKQEFRVGGAGNVAINAVTLGASTRLLGLVGEDDAADQLESLLVVHGIECSLQHVAGSKTITKLRVISRHQQIIRLDFEDLFPAWNPAQLLDVFKQYAQATDAVILSDYAKGALRNVQPLIAVARGLQLPVIVDPKGREFDQYRGATVLTPNLAEFEAVVGSCGSDEGELVRRAETLRKRLELDALLITRSEHGMTLVADGKTPTHLPTQAREVFDVTGAGDTVAAIVGAGLAAGLTLLDAVALSNIGAGIVVGKLGTASVTKDELRAALHMNAAPHSASGICSEEGLIAQRQWARAQGETVVMTNGCFDILHPGHIEYLEQARALGDILIVAVNDDNSVHRLKSVEQGVPRPINPLEHRMRMLSALACVDWVVPFSEDTPERLITRVLPDILVKGGDYLPEQIAGGKQVIEAGGRVQVLNFLPGHSTSKLIQKIRQEDRS
jgi:D-beta-D-heptose 7-phosphate kinase / D-beta-D-heptose 1-phosphate adenosyltransferase